MSPKVFWFQDFYLNTHSLHELLTAISSIESRTAVQNGMTPFSKIWKAKWNKIASWRFIFSVVETVIELFPKAVMSESILEFCEHILTDLLKDIAAKYPMSKNSPSSQISDAVETIVMILMGYTDIKAAADARISPNGRFLKRVVAEIELLRHQNLTTLFSKYFQRFFFYLSIRFEHFYLKLGNQEDSVRQFGKVKFRQSSIIADECKILHFTSKAIAEIIADSREDNVLKTWLKFFAVPFSVQNWISLLKSSSLIKTDSVALEQYFDRDVNIFDITHTSVFGLLLKIYDIPSRVFEDKKVEKGSTRFIGYFRNGVYEHQYVWESNMNFLIDSCLLTSIGNIASELGSLIVNLFEENRSLDLMKKTEILNTEKHSSFLDFCLKPVINLTKVDPSEQNKWLIFDQLQSVSGYQSKFVSVFFDRLWNRLEIVEESENVGFFVPIIKTIISSNCGIPYSSIVRSKLRQYAQHRFHKIPQSLTLYESENAIDTKIIPDYFVDLLTEIVRVRPSSADSELVSHVLEYSKLALQAPIDISLIPSVSEKYILLQKICKLANFAIEDYILKLLISCREPIIETLAFGSLQNDPELKSICIEGLKKLRSSKMEIRTVFGSSVIDNLIQKIRTSNDFPLKRRAETLVLLI
ncbi:hypothetical protein HK096_007580 [Nowakowskiella sp. JEL0078]|nr:hypothetical protein HK096_007580 [Nowakowskiella sp. JEL0078]